MATENTATTTATAPNNLTERKIHDHDHDYNGNSDMKIASFGGALQPGLHVPQHRKFANPAPLGLSAFALTTFVLSLINLRTRGLSEPHLVMASAFGYGGLVQLLAGMWEMAVGNTFGATALSSYGGFWITFGFILTPGLGIITTLEEESPVPFLDSMGFFLMGWFIFTFILLCCTLRSSVAFFLLFFTLDMAFLMLGIGHLVHPNEAPTIGLIKAGGAFGMLAAFLAWYNALAGIADSTNSFISFPVMHFPWSDKGRENRKKVNNSGARNGDTAV